MKQETITRIKLTATDGMIITDGRMYGRIIYLANIDNPEDFYEITEEEYNEILAREEAKAREEAEAIEHNGTEAL